MRLLGVHSKCEQAQVIFVAYFPSTLEDNCLPPQFLEPEAFQQRADRIETYGLVSEAKLDGADGLTSWMFIQAVRLSPFIAR